MTKKWSNRNLPGALHYVTGNVLHRIPIFTQERCCKAFLEVFACLLRDWPCKLIAFVLMPDHFHLFYCNSSEPLPVDLDWWWADDVEKLTKAMKERLHVKNFKE